MSRYRPPREKSSPYITAAGHARLKAEFEHLWRERRPDVVRHLAAAAAEGDRSENAEYQYRKKELREIDARLKYLTLRLDEVKIADLKPADETRVYFGAQVELADADTGAERSYRIVGADEADAAKGLISVDAPVARALLGRRVGDVVEVQLPAARVQLEIVAVSYPQAPEPRPGAPGQT
ncbi:MAG TPA: transcription elongation factor GreB [Solimonas sp.]|nr:transcription elongation factor GreB [Solimonas sp.]